MSDLVKSYPMDNESKIEAYSFQIKHVEVGHILVDKICQILFHSVTEHSQIGICMPNLAKFSPDLDKFGHVQFSRYSLSCLVTLCQVS